MKVHLNLDNFDNDVSPNNEVIDFIENSITLIPIGKSGIHIKEKTKGSFTKYCGGNVTDACIQKGKNSPNPAIRKKATFAANARKWKHQQGGSLLPGVNYSSISNLFVDTDSPPKFVMKKPKGIESEKLDLNLLETTTPKQESPTIESEKEPQWHNTIYQQEATPNLDFSVRDIDFANASMSDRMRGFLAPHMGITGNWGNYDCSNFATRVLHDMGYKNVGGTSRNLYAQTDRINMSDLKEGDLIFLQGTQNASRGLKAGQASHVAIVTDVSRLGEGYVQVAQGSPGKKTSIKEWNLNKGYYKDHYLGAGRVRSAKLGMKFQLGGLLTNLFVDSTPFQYQSQNDYSQTFQDVDTPPLFALKQQQQSESYGSEEPTWYNKVYSPKNKEKSNTPKQYSGERYNNFKKEFDNYLKFDPSAAKYEQVLTDIAKHESNFNFSIQNTAGAPAYGCFQFWQDGNINNITRFSGLSIDEFTRNPQAQIAAAVKMARSIENSFNSEDLRIASARGYNMNQLIRGAWLGGVGGVRKVLRGQGNPNDGKWYANGKGRSVKDAMNEQI